MIRWDGTGRAVNLTPGSGVRHGEPLLPKGRDSVMLYSQSSITAPDTQLVIQAIEPGSTPLVPATRTTSRSPEIAN